MNEMNHPDGIDAQPISGAESGPSEAVISQNPNVLVGKLSKPESLISNPSLSNAENVLHRAIEAAEHNQATEKRFELKHEVKDTGAVVPPATMQNIASVGQLLASRNQTQTAASSAYIERHKEQSSRMRHMISDQSLYGHAVRYGFLVAILSLLTAIMFVTLFT